MVARSESPLLMIWRNLQESDPVFYFSDFSHNQRKAMMQMNTDNKEPVAVASPIGNSVSGKILEVR